jgi:hypothetical protein
MFGELLMRIISIARGSIRLMSWTLLAITLSNTALAQDQQPPQRDVVIRRDGPGGNVEFRMPPLAIMEALDADKDGKLSKEEMKTASTALATLDKDKNGKLSAEEIGWPPRGGFGGRGGRGGFGGRGGRGGQVARNFGERLMKRDANGDGKVAADELPKSMHAILKRADRDSDGFVNQDEAKRLAEELGLAGGGERPN